VWIEIVIQNEVVDPRYPAGVGITKKERTAFTALAAPALPQSRSEPAPQEPGA
jgi:hypothetical protein